MKLRNTFDEVAELYDKIRPGYPDALFDYLVSKTKLDTNSKLLEIAPGTGQATLSLAKRGCNIIAIELGNRLADIARKNLGDYPNVRIITGAFEDEGFPSESFDLVYAATAFHWIDPEVKFKKAHNLLKPEGYLAVINGDWISDGPGSDFFHASQPIYGKYWSSDPNFQVRLRSLSEIEPPDLDTDLFTLNYFKCFPESISYTTEQYCRLLNTESAKLELPPEKRKRFLDEIRSLIDNRFNGKLSRFYSNSLTIANKKIA